MGMTIRQRLTARLEEAQECMRALVVAQRADRDRLQGEIDQIKALLLTWTDAKDVDVQTLRQLGVLVKE